MAIAKSRLAVMLIGILAVAAVSTAGDYVWFEIGVRHEMIFGVVHGAVLLAAVGAAVGATSGRLLAGIPAGAVSGVGGALVYYALVPAVGRSAMLAGWAAVWIVLSIFNARVIRRPRSSWSEAIVRGILAAFLGGLAFYLVVGILWGREYAADRNYLLQYAAWVIAWAPGIVAISANRSSRGAVW